MWDDELFVTGRGKDVLIIRGRNLYPQDIETAVSAVIPAIPANGCAAFGLEMNGEERLGLVIEWTAFSPAAFPGRLTHLLWSTSLNPCSPVFGLSWFANSMYLFL